MSAPGYNRCPLCGAALWAPDTKAVGSKRCPRCGTDLWALAGAAGPALFGRRPGEVKGVGSPLPSPARRGLPTAALFGLLHTAYHYRGGGPVWQEEAALLITALKKGFGELLGPLFFHEAAPPLFLWLTRSTSFVL